MAFQRVSKTTWAGHYEMAASEFCISMSALVKSILITIIIIIIIIIIN